MPKQNQRKKVIFAAGGTGGHLFPAQALAQQMRDEDPSVDLSFAGARLSTNAYLDQARFSYSDIASGTPFRGGLLSKFKTALVLVRGLRESLRLLKKEKPALVVGFGSFHAFPVLLAAVIKRIPLILFESNAMPGKVVRFFAKKALLTGIYFPEARRHLKGNSIEVEIPTQTARAQIPKEEARAALSLQPDLCTLLVFGGSQGAKAINQNFLSALELLHHRQIRFQVIHLTGCDQTASEAKEKYRALAISCHVVKFEPRMDLAWSAADIAICRSGALTVSEILRYAVPALMIPFPAASDRHQNVNAQYVERTIGGGLILDQEALTPDRLAEKISDILLSMEKKKKALQEYKASQKKENLASLVGEMLKKL
jgi:UDP-N-acetylglucosamine--N-acetylmuramyl-(pentapeptide) pyrophosphoryl-undecaprenol N-acetylglucosamine transferase